MCRRASLSHLTTSPDASEASLFRKGASISDGRSGWGRGSRKSRRNGQNQLICDSDRGWGWEGVKKFENFADVRDLSKCLPSVARRTMWHFALKSLNDLEDKIWDKISLTGCKWSNLNAQSTETTVSHPLLVIPISHFLPFPSGCDRRERTVRSLPSQPLLSGVINNWLSQYER